MGNYQYDYSSLKGLIVAKFGTIKEFSKALGITENSMSRKLNHLSCFTQDEIIKSSEILGIPSQQINKYFFKIK